MKVFALIAAITLTACRPSPPAYMITKTIVHPDGTEVTWTYSGPTLPALPTPELYAQEPER